MRRRLLVVGAFVAAVAASAIHSPAQHATPPTLSPAAIQGDQQAITRYVDYWIERLKSGESAAVMEARDKLIQPLAQNLGPEFVKSFDAIVARRLMDCLNVKIPLVRINTMIVAKSLKDQQVTSVIKKGLTDKSEAVLYISSDAAARLAADSEVPTQTKLLLLKPLEGAINDAHSGYLLDKLYAALNLTPHPDAWKAVIAKFNDRVVRLANRPQLGVDAELGALQQLLQVLVTENTTRPVAPDILKEFARASARFLDLSTRVNVNAEAQGSQSGAYKVMILRADAAVRWAGEQLRMPKMPDSVRNKSDNEQRLIADQWRQEMLSPQGPFKYKSEDIVLPKVMAPTESASDGGGAEAPDS